MEGKTQETAAAKAGMSVRSARKWQSGPLPSQAKPEHRWRTRPDPFDGVWEDEIEPLLRNDPTGQLKATTIIDWLAEQHPGRFSASQLRTLQRRLQDWRALHGPDQEVYFPQVHPPGREAQFDFTHCGELKVTIAGQSYPHLLFQLILSHSGWRYAEVAAGETFLALQQGLQNALWTPDPVRVQPRPIRRLFHLAPRRNPRHLHQGAVTVNPSERQHGDQGVVQFGLYRDNPRLAPLAHANPQGRRLVVKVQVDSALSAGVNANASLTRSPARHCSSINSRDAGSGAHSNSRSTSDFSRYSGRVGETLLPMAFRCKPLPRPLAGA